MANNHQFRFVTPHGADELWERNIYKEMNRHHQELGGPVGNDFDEVAHRIMQRTANNLGIHYTPSTTDTHVVHTFTHPTAHNRLSGQPTFKKASFEEMEEPSRTVTGRGYSSIDPSKTDETDIVRPFDV